jgi:hypothetical protein
LPRLLLRGLSAPGTSSEKNMISFPGRARIIYAEKTYGPPAFTAIISQVFADHKYFVEIIRPPDKKKID